MKLCSLFIYSSDIEEGAIVFRLIADLAGVLVHDNRNALDVGDFLAISVIEDGKCLHEDIFDSEKVTGHVIFSFALALNSEIPRVLNACLAGCELILESSNLLRAQFISFLVSCF